MSLTKQRIELSSAHTQIIDPRMPVPPVQMWQSNNEWKTQAVTKLDLTPKPEEIIPAKEYILSNSELSISETAYDMITNYYKDRFHVMMIIKGVDAALAGSFRYDLYQLVCGNLRVTRDGGYTNEYHDQKDKAMNPDTSVISMPSRNSVHRTIIGLAFFMVKMYKIDTAIDNIDTLKFSYHDDFAWLPFSSFYPQNDFQENSVWPFAISNDNAFSNTTTDDLKTDSYLKHHSCEFGHLKGSRSLAHITIDDIYQVFENLNDYTILTKVQVNDLTMLWQFDIQKTLVTTPFVKALIPGCKVMLRGLPWLKTNIGGTNYYVSSKNNWEINYDV